MKPWQLQKLPWKAGNYYLPTNYKLSQSRLHGQLKKLRKEPEKLRAHEDKIQEQIKEGIVERVERSSPSERVHNLLKMSSKPWKDRGKLRGGHCGVIAKPLFVG